MYTTITDDSYISEMADGYKTFEEERKKNKIMIACAIGGAVFGIGLVLGYKIHRHRMGQLFDICYKAAGILGAFPVILHHPDGRNLNLVVTDEPTEMHLNETQWESVVL